MTGLQWMDKVKGTQVRMYDRVFLYAQPDSGGKDFIASQNPNRLKIVTAIVEPSFANALPDQNFQFELQGYFVEDRADEVQVSKSVFNLPASLKDTWNK